MAIPQHTFEFEGSQYLRYPPDPWLTALTIPDDWFAANIYEFLYSWDHVVQEALPYKINEGPWAAGIYFLLNGSTITYVGKSVEILKRLNDHRKKGWEFDRYWCFGGIPELYIEYVEAFYIHVFTPLYNDKYPYLHNVAQPLVELAKNGLLEYKYALTSLTKDILKPGG